ncbi:MAG: hypothetical protein J6P03_09100 [Opitutales bacterium]|nr:hypothetical protein [Opitutales bacterium]
MSQNLFELPKPRGGEIIETLVERGAARVEKISSFGCASPKNFWYDQPESEWVCLLKGGAEILFEGDSSPKPLREGDWLFIEPRRRHRVEKTSADCVWLAFFF